MTARIVIIHLFFSLALFSLLVAMAFAAPAAKAGCEHDCYAIDHMGGPDTPAEPRSATRPTIAG